MSHFKMLGMFIKVEVALKDWTDLIPLPNICTGARSDVDLGHIQKEFRRRFMWYNNTDGPSPGSCFYLFMSLSRTDGFFQACDKESSASYILQDSLAAPKTPWPPCRSHYQHGASVLRSDSREWSRWPHEETRSKIWGVVLKTCQMLTQLSHTI